jgi:TPR repeat protein
MHYAAEKGFLNAMSVYGKWLLTGDAGVERDVGRGLDYLRMVVQADPIENDKLVREAQELIDQYGS